MTLAAAIKAMVALGFTAEQIGGVVEKVDGERREKARAGNAKRQAEHRARHSKSNANNGVTGVTSNGDNGVTETGVSSRARVLPWEDSKYIPPDEPNGSSTPRGVGVPKKSRSQNRGTRLPDDWQPKAEHLELALGLGLGRDRYQRALDEFRDYWRGVPGTRGTKLDWDATFRNRLRDIAQREAGPQARAGLGGGGAGNLSTLMQKMRDQQNGQQSTSELKDITPIVSESRASDHPARLHEPSGKPSGGGKGFDFGSTGPNFRGPETPQGEAARAFDWPDFERKRG